MLRRSVPGPHANLGQPVPAFCQNEVVLEELEVLEEDVGTIGDDLLPIRARRLRHGRAHEAEVLRAVVGADVEVIAEVIDIVLVAAPARLEDLERLVGVRGRDEAIFVRQCLRRADHDVRLGLRLEDEGVVGVVLFFVDELVRRGGGADDVAIDPIPAQGHRVVPRIEQRPVVFRPRDVAGDMLHHLGEDFARAQVLDAQRRDPPPHRIDGEREQVLPRADLPAHHLEERFALSHGVAVDEDLFGRRERAALARVDRIVLTLHEPRIVEVAALPVGNGLIVLPHAPLQFVEQPVLQRLRVRHDRLGICVFVLEVLDDFGVVALAQPVVLVDAYVAVLVEAMRPHRRHGWRERRRCRRCRRGLLGDKRRGDKGREGESKRADTSGHQCLSTVME